jgi:hypothetical protein
LLEPFRMTAAIRYNTTGLSLDEKLLHGDSFAHR